MTTWDDGQKQLHDELLDLTIVGAYHISRGLTEFSAWSKAMLAEECSEDIRQFLRMIFANSKDMSEIGSSGRIRTYDQSVNSRQSSCPNSHRRSSIIRDLTPA